MYVYVYVYVCLFYIFVFFSKIYTVLSVVGYYMIDYFFMYCCVVGGIQVVKMFAWEEPLIKRLFGIR